jgi:3-hydroxybutyryl-CoA dehydrogenase
MNNTMQRVSIIGAGVMGHGLATVFAMGDHKVTLYDVSAQALGSAAFLIEAALQTLEDSGLVDPKKHESVAGRITTTTNLGHAVAHADLVVEAVTEDAAVKRDVFAKLDIHAPQHAVFASNTSYLNVFALIPRNRQPNSLIMHWYTPPYIIDLVDVVPGPHTRPSVIARITTLLKRLHKKPLVLKKFIAGFIANRLQAAVNLEVFSLLDKGLATPEQIDTAITIGLALRMPLLGHLKKADYTGLRMVQQGLASRSYRPPKPTGRSRVLDRHVRLGHTGVMAGRGFYDYGNRSAQDLFRERDRKLLALKKFLEELANEELGKSD